jgi:hypothetical protein
MPEALEESLAWGIPALVVFGVAAIAIIIAIWLLRRARRSPRARAAAEAQRAQAGITLVRLDDAVDELDLEVGLSGALYGGNAPASLRRARLTSQHVRDTSFEEYRAISGTEVVPDEIRRVATRIQRRCTDALGAIAAALTEHSAWVQSNVSATRQVAAAQERLRTLRAAMGDPTALVAELSGRFDEDEWAEASRAARAAVNDADSAERLLANAARAADDPTRSALPDLAAAERSLRRAEADSRILEEAHRLATQAAQAVPGEFEAARGALRQANSVRDQLESVDAGRLGAEIRVIEGELTALETDAARRPARTIDGIARLRDRLDLALGDARTAQQRIRGARTALPGTLAAARNAIAHAEASVIQTRAGADARSRLASAQRELASARQVADPVEALDAARRAMRDAEDAKALADYDRLGRR